MFYSYDILNPRKGKLAVVWLVATGRFKYHRRQDKNFRDVISVKVHNTCDEILRYVLRGGSRVEGRFSLYLSSMLMFGTVKVYHRQINFLLDETLEAFQTLKRQRLLMLELDAPVTGKVRVTLDPLVEQVPVMGLTPVSRLTGSLSPRKRDQAGKVTPVARTSVTETEIDLAMLENDWIEETPKRARSQDITMRDEELLVTSSRMLEEQQELMRSIGPLDLGPCFSTWEGPSIDQPAHPTLEGIRKSRAFDEVEPQMTELEVTPLAPCVPPEQPVPVEATLQKTPLTREPGIEIQPPTEETPVQQAPEPSAELIKKGAAPPSDVVQTPDVTKEAAPVRTVDTAQMELEPVDLEGSRRNLRRRRRRLIVDQNIHIPSEVIRAQTRDWGATMRVRTASEAVINVHWHRWMVPVSQLMSQVRHRRPLATPLAYLLTRHYRADPAQEHWDFLSSVRRQLQLVDESGEARAIDVSSMTDASALQDSRLEISKASSSKSIQLSPKPAQVEVPAHPSLIQDSTQLLPIQEEQGVREQVSLEVTPMAVPLLQEDQQQPEEPLVNGLPRLPTPSKKTPVRPPTPGVKRPRLDEEIHLATPTDESRRQQKRVSSYVPPDITPPRGPLRSPESGSNIVTVEAEVHQQEQQISDEARTIPPPATPEEALGILTDKPPTGTQKFDVMPQIPSLFEEIGVAQEGVSMFEPSEQQPLEEIVPHEPVGMPGPHTPPGPPDTSVPFIPSFISPVRYTPPLSRSYQETEKELTDLIPSRTQTTFEDLLPQNATRREVAHMFSALLEMHKKRIVRLSQESFYATIYVTRL